jgi:hypothetical protein
MSEAMELARERIKPLMRKEANKYKIPSARRIWDFFTSTDPSARGPEKLEWGIPAGVAGLEAGRGEYSRRSHNTEQQKVIDDIVNDVEGKGWFKSKEEGGKGYAMSDIEDVLKGGKGRGIRTILEARGFTGLEDFSPTKQGLRSLLVGASASPKYTRKVMQNPGSKAIRHAEATMDPAALAAWKKANIPEPMVRAGIGVGSTALLHQADKVGPAIGGVLEGGVSLGESGKKQSEILGKIEDMVGESDKKVGDVLGDIGEAASMAKETMGNIKEQTSPEGMTERGKELAGGIAEGLVTGAKREFKKVSDWAKANPGLAVSSGAGLIGLYAAYRIYKENQKRKRKEEEAAILAKALRRR